MMQSVLDPLRPQQASQRFCRCFIQQLMRTCQNEDKFAGLHAFHFFLFHFIIRVSPCACHCTHLFWFCHCSIAFPPSSLLLPLPLALPKCQRKRAPNVFLCGHIHRLLSHSPSLILVLSLSSHTKLSFIVSFPFFPYCFFCCPLILSLVITGSLVCQTLVMLTVLPLPFVDSIAFSIQLSLFQMTHMCYPKYFWLITSLVLFSLEKEICIISACLAWSWITSDWLALTIYHTHHSMV